MYFGSVRFFRHLIIAVIILVLLLPVFLAVYFGIQCSVIKKELRETKQIITELDIVTPDELENGLNNLSNSIMGWIDELEDELAELISGQTPMIEQSVDEKISTRFDEFRKLTSDPMILQLDMMQKKLDESMQLQASAFQEQMSSKQAAVIEQQLEELMLYQQDLEKYLNYINTAIDEYARGNQDNP